MVKPRHYAFMTVLAAVLITVLPTGVFVLMGRSPFLDEKQATSQSHLDGLQLQDDSASDHSANRGDARREIKSKLVPTTPKPVVQAPADKPVVKPTAPAPPVVQPAPVESVAETEAPRSAGGSRSLYGSGGYWGTDEIDMTGRIASAEDRAPKPAAADPVPAPAVEPPDLSEYTRMAAQLAAQIAAKVPIDIGDATGHRIQAPATAGDMGGSPPEAVPDKTTDSDSSDSNRRKSRKNRKKPSSESTLPSPMISPQTQSADNVRVVDMILQTPVESRRVRRVENVVATTNETGWPIALVRSGLPDSRWWVQQMTSIRGNAFTARVNFGNTNSISGGKYSLIFVFLDTQEEVTRFRIAKQFKDIPKGVRRTREYHFVLR